MNSTKGLLIGSIILFLCSIGFLAFSINTINPVTINGTQLVVGPQGELGIQGPVGPQGNKGDKGNKGEQGIQGIQGIQGKQGEEGKQGPKGDKGDQGEQGFQGLQGIQGPKGDTGNVGPVGPKGEKGDPGEQGPQGPPGESSPLYSPPNTETETHHGSGGTLYHSIYLNLGDKEEVSFDFGYCEIYLAISDPYGTTLFETNGILTSSGRLFDSYVFTATVPGIYKVSGKYSSPTNLYGSITYSSYLLLN